MINLDQFRELIVRPTLLHINMHSEAAENLLIGTALVETNTEEIRQLGPGPALSFYQIEPATHDDIWENYLSHRPERAYKVRDLISHRFANAEIPASELIGNLPYATAIARVKYWRVPEPLPKADDVEGLAAYWKQHYNTEHGAGNPAKFVKRYKRAFL